MIETFKIFYSIVSNLV